MLRLDMMRLFVKESKMKISELKKIIQDLPDDTFVVVPGNDHSYRKNIDVYRINAEYFENKFLLEYSGKENMSDENSKVVQVLVIV